MTIRVLWTHNFDPSIPNAGCFMYPVLAGLRNLGINVSLEYLGNLRSPAAMFAARKRLPVRVRDFDIVHAQYGSACALVTAAIRDRPLVVTIRGSDWADYKSRIGLMAWLHNRVARMMTLHALPHFDAVVSVSYRLWTSLRQFAAGAQFLVLPSAIDLKIWPSGNLDEATGMNLRQKRVLFISLNSNNPVKRSELCKKVMTRVREKLGEEVQLCVASGIPREEMPTFVAGCDVILCTSEAEGWPNSIKEALACNVPFVSTDVSDLRAIAEQEASCRVCSDDPDELADNLCEVLRMRRPENLRRFVEPMDVGVSSEKLASFYEMLLNT